MTGEMPLTDLALFSYDPDTGVLLYLVTGRPFTGELNGRWFKAHRIAWRLQTGNWPEGVIDHINGNDSDNRFANLRDTTSSGNSKNQKISSRNTSGVVGIYWRKDVSRWQARITSEGKAVHLGYYDDFNAALVARKAAEIEYNFHPNHGEQR